MRLIDLTGRRFGRLVVIERATNEGRRTRWTCRCDCGTICTPGAEALHAGLTQSCGCLARELVRARSLKHGATVGYKPSKEYKAWLHAKERCYVPKTARFPSYGGRGISMCAAWRDDFATFLRDMGPCPPGHSLDRIDVNGNYEPGNVRWATMAQQMANTQLTYRIKVADGEITLKELARRYGVNYGSLHSAVCARGRDPIQAARRLATKAHR